MHYRIFDKTVVCLREKQGVMVNDDWNSWYNRVGDFLMLAYERKEKFCMVRDQLVRILVATPLLSLSVRPVATIAMAVECE